MELQQKIDRITDILRRDDGISGAMHYTEQISWILFLKFLNDFEEEKEGEALLNNTKYERIIADEYQWNHWACPKNNIGKPDSKNAKTGDDLTKFVNSKLFPYLKGFKVNINELKSVKYKIGNVFEFLDNRIASGHTLREVLDIIDTLNFQSQEELFELSHVYENLLQGMGSDGGNSGEFYTPRAVIKVVIEALQPEPGQTIYDGAAGSCGFLIEAFEFIKSKYRNKLSTNQWQALHEDTFFGNEKTPLAYTMGVMNMILHGIESPNLYKQNTLTNNIRDIQEKDRYDIIIANPPFGGKEKPQIQQNFPIQANATELLFLQHFMKSLKKGGKAAIVIPEGVLFQTGNAFRSVKEELLSNFNLHTILSLPAGVFLPYSGVKTNVLFFDRKGATSEIWYYECNPEQKLTKNKPIQYEHLKEFVDLFPKRALSQNSWLVNVKDILDTDLSAKNPNISIGLEHMPPKEILSLIKKTGDIDTLIEEIEDAFISMIKKRNEHFNSDLPKFPLKKAITRLNSGFACNKNNEALNGYVHLRTHNIGLDGSLNFDQIIRIKEDLVDKKKSYLTKGDVIFNNTNSKELVGKSAYVDKDYPYAYSNHLTIIKLNELLLGEYLVEYFIYLRHVGIFESICNKWIGQAGINNKMLESIEVPMPDIKIQNHISENLMFLKKRCNGIINHYQIKINQVQALKASILDKAFKGEL